MQVIPIIATIAGTFVFVCCLVPLFEKRRIVFYAACILSFILIFICFAGLSLQLMATSSADSGLAGLALMILYVIPLFISLVVAAFILSLVYEYKHQPAEPISFRFFAKITDTYTTIFLILFLILIFLSFHIEHWDHLLQILVTLAPAIVFGFLTRHRIAKQTKSFYMMFVVFVWIMSCIIISTIYIINNSFKEIQVVSKMENNNSNIKSALETNNYSACIRFTNDSYCAEQLALKNKDVSYCLRLSDGGLTRGLYQCILALAQQEKDGTVCETYSGSARAVADCKKAAGEKVDYVPIIAEEFEKKRGEIENSVQTIAGDLGITIDAIESGNQDNLFSVTAHFASKNFDFGKLDDFITALSKEYLQVQRATDDEDIKHLEDGQFKLYIFDYNNWF